MQEYKPSELSQWVDALLAEASDRSHEKMLILLDVREPWELERANVLFPPRSTTTGSLLSSLTFLSIPMHSIPQRVCEVPLNRPIACLCHHGMRSAQVAFFLQQNGYENVVNIRGGIHAWAEQLDASVGQY